MAAMAAMAAVAAMVAMAAIGGYFAAMAAIGCGDGGYLAGMPTLLPEDHKIGIGIIASA